MLLRIPIQLLLPVTLFSFSRAVDKRRSGGGDGGVSERDLEAWMIDIVM